MYSSGTIRYRSNPAAGMSRVPLIMRFNATHVLMPHYSVKDLNSKIPKLTNFIVHFHTVDVTLSPTVIMKNWQSATTRRDTAVNVWGQHEC